MNGTVIDMPGITVNVNPITCEHSTDLAYIVELKDQHDHKVTVSICYGKITSIETK